MRHVFHYRAVRIFLSLSGLFPAEMPRNPHDTLVAKAGFGLGNVTPPEVQQKSRKMVGQEDCFPFLLGFGNFSGANC